MTPPISRDSVQNYVDLVNGATRATRDRATAAARGLLAQAGLEDAANDAQERFGKLADDITNASRANREMVEKLVAGEVEKVALRLGFARAAEVQELRAEVQDLRSMVEESAVAAVVTPPPVRRVAVKRAPVKQAPVGKAPVRRSPASSVPLEVPVRQPAKKAPTKQAPTKKVPADRTTPPVKTAKVVPARKMPPVPDPRSVR